MPQRCRVCNHPEREKIEALILVGKEGKGRIASMFGLSEKSVRNHTFNCLGLPHERAKSRSIAPSQAEVVRDRMEYIHDKNLFEELDELDQITRRVISRNEKKGEDRTVIMAVTASKGLAETKADWAFRKQAIKMQEEGLKVEIELVGDDGNGTCTDQ